MYYEVTESEISYRCCVCSVDFTIFTSIATDLYKSVYCPFCTNQVVCDGGIYTIDELRSTVSGLEEDIKQLENKVENLECNVGNLEEERDRLEDRVDELNQELEECYKKEGGGSYEL